MVSEVHPMTCSLHPDIDSVAFCGQCGRALCRECKREVGGMIYCESCLDARLRGSALPPIMGPNIGPNPGLALFLGFIPGVGSIYNGQIVKAMVQVLIFGSLIALADRVGGPFDTIFGLGALFLLDNLGIHVFEHISKFWPVLLIVIGLIMLQRRVAKGPTSTPPPA